MKVITVTTVLLPVFVQVALTFGLMFWMGRQRFGALRWRETRVADIALGQKNWTEPAAQAGNSFSNQFELPVLFYALVAFALFTRKADYLFVILSWLFVILRIGHAFIHVTTNNITHRFSAYVIGALVLLMMWVIFAVRLLTGA